MRSTRRAEETAHRFRAVTRNERDSPGLLVGVDNAQQAYKLFGIHRRPDLDTNGVAEATEEPGRRSEEGPARS